MTIHFLEKVRADILRLPLDNGLLRMVEDAQQMGELKTFPLVLDLYSEEMFDAVFFAGLHRLDADFFASSVEQRLSHGLLFEYHGDIMEII